MAAKSGFFENNMMTATADGDATQANVTSQTKDTDLGYLKPFELSRRQLSLLAPYISGRAIFVPTQMPKHMVYAFSAMTSQFAQLILTTATRYELAVDKSAEMGTVEAGNEGQAMDYVSKTTGVPRECSITFPAEKYDGFLTAFQSAWMEGNQSSVDGVSGMYGMQGLAAPSNMCMEGLYIVFDPSERVVIRAIYCTNMLPKISPESIYNATKGEYAHQEVTLQYSCMGITGDSSVLAVAQAYLDDLNAKRDHVTRLEGTVYGEFEIPQSGENVLSV